MTDMWNTARHRPVSGGQFMDLVDWDYPHRKRSTRGGNSCAPLTAITPSEGPCPKRQPRSGST